MSDFSLTRRSLLSGTALLLASTALPTIGWAQEPQKGGRLTVAADSEPRNLNPAIVASNGVFFISSKIIEPLAEADYDGKDGSALASPRAGKGRKTASPSPSSCART